MLRRYMSLLKLCHRARRAAVLLVTMIIGTSFAQTPAGKQPSSGTQILFLGTAGGPPLRLDRSEPSTLLIVDGRPYLIDCGIGTIRRMVEAGVASQSIKTIFLTHLHADHDLGLADVMANDFFTLNLAGSGDTVDVYGPPQTKDLVDAAFHYVALGFTAFAAEPGAIRAGLVNGQLKSPFVAHEMDHDGVVYQDDKIRVTAAENTHYALMPAKERQQMKSYSYRIETPHGVIVFTGDTGPSDAVVRLAKGADVLLAEVEDLDEVTRFVHQVAVRNHWSSQRLAAMMDHMRQEHLGQEEVGRMATQAQVRSLVLYHYDPDNTAAYITAVKKYFAGPVFASADLDRYCLDGTSGARSLVPCATSATKPRTADH